MQSLRGWLLAQSDEELETLRSTPRFATAHNRRVLETVIRERLGEPLADSWEDVISKERYDAVQSAASALIVARGVDITRRVDVKPLAAELAAQQGCHIDTAKRHIARAVRLARGELPPQWGGTRPGPHPGRPQRTEPTDD